MATLLDPLRIKGMTLKNRIVMPPMANDLATEDGEVTDRTIQHYVARAANEVGLMMVEHSYVDPSGRHSRRQLGIHKDALVPALRRLADAIHDAGAVTGIQITHAGARTSRDVLDGLQPAAPSPVPLPGSDDVPRPLSVTELRGLTTAFAEAARRAREAGFDAVEIHGAHGFLLNEFVSAYMNRRDDEYGGTFENRLRFPLEVVHAVRAVLGPDFPLFYRLGAEDGVAGGITLHEAQRVARVLQDAGIDCLNVSGGLIGSRPKGRTEQGFFLPQAEGIKQVVTVPVIGVGGIVDAAFADQAVRHGQADLIAVGRALLKDPLWARRAIEKLRPGLES